MRELGFNAPVWEDGLNSGWRNPWPKSGIAVAIQQCKEGDLTLWESAFLLGSLMRKEVDRGAQADGGETPDQTPGV